MDPSQVATGLAANPLAWFCALLIGTTAYLFKANQELTKSLIELINTKDKEHRDTLERIVPLAESLESIIESLLKKGSV